MKTEQYTVDMTVQKEQVTVKVVSKDELIKQKETEIKAKKIVTK
jgi:hypothetical protein